MTSEDIRFLFEKMLGIRGTEKTDPEIEEELGHTPLWLAMFHQAEPPTFPGNPGHLLDGPLPI